MGRGVVKIIIQFLHIFTMIALAIGQTKQSFLYIGIFRIPECEAEAKELFNITDPCNAVFTPAINAVQCSFIRRIIPGIGIFAVVFTYGSPLPVGYIRSPFLPFRVLKPLLFCIHAFEDRYKKFFVPAGTDMPLQGHAGNTIVSGEKLLNVKVYWSCPPRL